MLYDIFINPFVYIIEKLYLILFSITSDYGISLLLLSLVTSILIIFLNWCLSFYPKREKQIQHILSPQIAKIKKESTGAERHSRIKNLYSRYSYNPIYAFRSVIPFLIQLPFLLASFYMLSRLKALEGVSFLAIQDLSSPDRLIANINVLPVLMTIINVITALISLNLSRRDRTQALLISLLFLTLLYKAPSALLIYWTMNNILFFAQAVYARKKSVKMPVENKDYWKVELPFSRVLWRKLWNLIMSQRIIDLAGLIFSFLVLYNLLQAVADINGGGLFLYRFSKTLSFLIAAFCWCVLSLISFSRKYEKSIRSYLILIIIAINLTIITAFIINYLLQIIPFGIQGNKALLFVTSLFILTALTINIFTKRDEEEIFKFKISKGYVILFMLPLIPGLHLAASNTDYLTGWYYFLYFTIIFLLIIISYLWAIASFPYKNNKQKLLLYTALFVFLFLSLPIVRAMLSTTNRPDIDFWIILAVSFIILYNIKFKKLKNIFILLLAILLTINIGNFLFCMFSSDGKKPYQYVEIPEQLKKISFNKKPNIYLLVYDGVPNEKVFNQQGISFEKLRTLLTKYKYKIYPNTYTLGFNSMTSMASMLNITKNLGSRGQMQDTYAGNSVANLFLRKNGYKTFMLLNNYHTGVYAVQNKKIVDEYYPPKILSAVQIDFFVTLLRGILQGELDFDTKGLIVEDYNENNVQKRKNEIIKMPKEKAFIVNHYPLPSHSQNSGRLLPNETELWIKRFDQALLQLEKDLDTINIFDPESLVIVIGDHGPYLTGDGLILSSYKTNDITTDMIWDRLGTLVAIKWPEENRAKKYDKNLILNQDIFPVVFSYLSDTAYPLELMPERTVTGFRKLSRPNGIKFRRGEIIN